MTPTLVIANKAYSSWSMRPWLVMTHFGLPFEEVVVPMGQADTRDTMLRYAPTGKCPSLHRGDIAVWDSLAIIETLADLHPDAPIWPRDPAARAHARSVSAEMHSGFMALRGEAPMNIRRPVRPIALGAAALADAARLCEAITEARTRFGAGGDFMYGAFCAADAMLGPIVNRFHVYGVAVPAPVRAWMDAMMGLPAWRAWARDAAAEPWRLERYESI